VFWILYFSIIEVVQMKGNEWDVTEYGGFWNIFDITRIILIGSFMIVDYKENDSAVEIVYFLMTIHSWLGLLEQLRVFEKY
jgi:hypothetical protein